MPTPFPIPLEPLADVGALRVIKAADTEGADALAFLRVIGPSFQAPMPPDVFVNFVGGPVVVTSPASATLVTVNVPGDRQLRIAALACVVDDPGMIPMVAFTVNANGNPIHGFNQTFAVGAMSEPARVWLNILGPATVTVVATNNALLSTALTVSARLVGWLYAEVSR